MPPNVREKGLGFLSERSRGFFFLLQSKNWLLGRRYWAYVNVVQNLLAHYKVQLSHFDFEF